MNNKKRIVIPIKAASSVKMCTSKPQSTKEAFDELFCMGCSNAHPSINDHETCPNCGNIMIPSEDYKKTSKYAWEQLEKSIIELISLKEFQILMVVFWIGLVLISIFL